LKHFWFRSTATIGQYTQHTNAIEKRNFFKKGYLMVDSIIQKARKIKADFQGFFLFGEKKSLPYPVV
jgi:hypothetical protein